MILSVSEKKWDFFPNQLHPLPAPVVFVVNTIHTCEQSTAIDWLCDDQLKASDILGGRAKYR